MVLREGITVNDSCSIFLENLHIGERIYGSALYECIKTHYEHIYDIRAHYEHTYNALYVVMVGLWLTLTLLITAAIQRYRRIITHYK